MSHLSGKLETFSLRQILVLLADADTTGELHMTSATVAGRIFFQSGVVAYGTTRAGEDSVAELDRLLELAGGDMGEEPRSGVKEQLTEVLHEFTQLESGTFDFFEGELSMFDVGVTFTVAELFRLVDERIEEWRKIRQDIPSTVTRLNLALELPGGRSEVMVNKDAWDMLATVAGGASITDVAKLREVSEFRAAKSLAELVRRQLLTTEDSPTPSPRVRSVFSKLESLEDPPPELREDPQELLEAPPPELREDPQELLEEDPQELLEAPPQELLKAPPPELPEDPQPASPAEPEKKAATPQVEPKVKPVSFSKKDLSPEERDELIRNIGKGIYPSD